MTIEPPTLKARMEDLQQQVARLTRTAQESHRDFQWKCECRKFK